MTNLKIDSSMAIFLVKSDTVYHPRKFPLNIFDNFFCTMIILGMQMLKNLMETRVLSRS